MFKKIILLSLGLSIDLFSADYASIFAAYEQNPNSANTVNLNKANIKIVLDVLNDREQHSTAFTGNLAQTIEEFNSAAANDQGERI